MKRGGPLRRHRKKPGVTGRPSLSARAWILLKQDLWRRAGGRCEVPSCRTSAFPLDPHHVVKRSQGGADDLDNLVLLCRPHHEQTDAAYQDGRLVLTYDHGRLMFRTVWARDKITARSASAWSIEPSAGGGRTGLTLTRRDLSLYPTVAMSRRAPRHG